MADRTLRPAGVTVVAVIAWISGALDVLAGILQLIGAGVIAVTPQWGGAAAVWTSGIISIIVGVITIVVAGALLGGNVIARAIIAVLQIVSIVGSTYGLLSGTGNPVAEWFSIAIAIVVLILLFSNKANRFFAS